MVDDRKWKPTNTKSIQAHHPLLDFLDDAPLFLARCLCSHPCSFRQVALWRTRFRPKQNNRHLLNSPLWIGEQGLTCLIEQIKDESKELSGCRSGRSLDFQGCSAQHSIHATPERRSFSHEMIKGRIDRWRDSREEGWDEGIDQRIKKGIISKRVGNTKEALG